MIRKEEFIFDNLPKLSQNEALAMHWGKRKKIREQYENAIMHLIYKRFNDQLLTKFAKTKYTFQFKKNPLDCLNCCEMVKIIEDIVFKKDTPKEIERITMISYENIYLKTDMQVILTIEWDDE